MRKRRGGAHGGTFAIDMPAVAVRLLRALPLRGVRSKIPIRATAPAFDALPGVCVF
jgi:hypothetical protein